MRFCYIFVVFKTKHCYVLTFSLYVTAFSLSSSPTVKEEKVIIHTERLKRIHVLTGSLRLVYFFYWHNMKVVMEASFTPDQTN